MGNTFHSKTIDNSMMDKYDSNGFRALGGWTGSMLKTYKFDDSIKDECYNIIEKVDGKGWGEKFTVYLDGNTVMCIKYNNKIHISDKAKSTSFGYTNK